MCKNLQAFLNYKKTNNIGGKMNIYENTYSVNLDFEVIKLPPVTDILVLGKKVPQGKFGILHSFELISPDVFELLEIDESMCENVEAVIINKSILQKIPRMEVLNILNRYVFPFATKGETLKVNFNIHIYYKNINGDLNDDT